MFGLQLPFYSPLYKGTRNANRLRKGWAKGTSAADLTIPGSGRKILVPKLTDIAIASETGSDITALVDMATVGATARDLERKIETVTASLHAYSTKVERQTPALARITVSFDPPQRPTYNNGPHSNDNQLLDLEQFPIFLDPTTQDAAILLTKSLMIGGESESGKSNLVWYILSQLNDNHIPYRLWVIDPAGGVELNDLEQSPLTRQYVDRAKDIPALVDKFRESMDNRLRNLKKRGQRRHFPTIAEPVEICLIDELLLCKTQLKDGDAASPLGEVLTVGRKALHIVIGCSQLGEKLAIGQIRDLFPQRICLRTRSQDITDAVLGSNATVDGAVCHRITQRGEGYVFTDTSQMFEKFHAPLVRETLSIAGGGTTVPTTPPPSSRAQQLRERRKGRTFLYQFFPDNMIDPNHPQYNRPVYVGITYNPRQRFKKHEKEWPQAYWNQINHRRTKIQAYPTWQQAKDMETDLIAYYQPIYNVQERSA
jgi:hypothetical protein